MKTILSAAAAFLLLAAGSMTVQASQPEQAAKPAECAINTSIFEGNKCECPQGTKAQQVSKGYRQCRPAAAPAAATSSIFPIAREMRFERDRKYPSPSGNHYLVFQGDGNLVVYTSADKPVWALNSLTPNWRKNGYAIFQKDGNLATYAADNAYIWSARHVVSPAGTKLHLTAAGELQIVDPSGKVLWNGGKN